MKKNLFLLLLFVTSAIFTNTASCVTGTWALTDSDESGGKLLIYQNKNTARFQLERYIGPPTYNSGFIEGSMEIHGQKGRFHSEDPQCEIRFNFKKDRVDVSHTAGDCGFGMGVSASGTYLLNDSKKPRFYRGDPRTNDSERE